MVDESLANTIHSMNVAKNDMQCVNAMDAKTGKKFVGESYCCENCGEIYKARTVWQKYCQICGEAKRAKYKKKFNTEV